MVTVTGRRPGSGTATRWCPCGPPPKARLPCAACWRWKRRASRWNALWRKCGPSLPEVESPTSPSFICCRIRRACARWMNVRRFTTTMPWWRRSSASGPCGSPARGRATTLAPSASCWMRSCGVLRRRNRLVSTIVRCLAARWRSISGSGFPVRSGTASHRSILGRSALPTVTSLSSKLSTRRARSRSARSPRPLA